MNLDPEIKAMSDVADALSALDPEAVRRVLKWALERYQVKTPVGASHIAGGQGMPEAAPTSSFDDFASLFDAANPQNAPDRALVAGYWFQVLQGHEDLDAFQLNKELKNLGHPSTNITRDLDALLDRTPRQVMQVRKSGITKQARKRYKLTRDGISAVKRLLSAATRQEGAEG